MGPEGIVDGAQIWVLGYKTCAFRVYSGRPLVGITPHRGPPGAAASGMAALSAPSPPAAVLCGATGSGHPEHGPVHVVEPRAHNRSPDAI